MGSRPRAGGGGQQDGERVMQTEGAKACGPQTPFGSGLRTVVPSHCGALKP